MKQKFRDFLARHGVRRDSIPALPPPQPQTPFAKANTITARPGSWWRSNGLNLAGLLVACGALYIYRQQSNTMTDQLKEAQLQRRLSVRPWVGLADEIDPLYTTPIHINEHGDATGNYFMKIKNYSSVAAQEVFGAAQIVLSADMREVDKAETGICAENAIGGYGLGTVLWPGKLLQTQTFPMIQAKSWRGKPDYLGKYGVFLVGCIGYRDQFGWFYTTGFIFSMRNGSTGAVQTGAEPNTDIVGSWAPSTGHVSDGSVSPTQAH